MEVLAWKLFYFILHFKIIFCVRHFILNSNVKRDSNFSEYQGEKIKITFKKFLK